MFLIEFELKKSGIFEVFVGVENNKPKKSISRWHVIFIYLNSNIQNSCLEQKFLWYRMRYWKYVRFKIFNIIKMFKRDTLLEPNCSFVFKESRTKMKTDNSCNFISLHWGHLFYFDFKNWISPAQIIICFWYFCFSIILICRIFW